MSDADLKARRARLLTPLAEALAEHGFAPNASADRFVRPAGELEQHFLLTFLDAKPGWRVRPSVGVRCEAVERRLHVHSGIAPSARNTTTTVGGTLSALIGSAGLAAFDAVVHSSDDPALAAPHLIAAFRDAALPWFGAFRTTADLEAFLNSDERRDGQGPPPLQFGRGLILARLLGRPDYEALRRRLTERMTALNNGFYLKPFEAIAGDLEAEPLGAGV